MDEHKDRRFSELGHTCSYELRVYTFTQAHRNCTDIHKISLSQWDHNEDRLQKTHSWMCMLKLAQIDVFGDVLSFGDRSISGAIQRLRRITSSFAYLCNASCLERAMTNEITILLKHSNTIPEYNYNYDFKKQQRNGYN